ncbi:MarR family winged helix-turn-helix transcriptional regulator [Microbacterium sp. cx-59]|uniref:MarR family winged helix-turn-helix transcriptional regulator n=1 Tax=Microbacterium sp. cx-59 TaxID=2891207 RepID=UPI001E32CF08|nr:MarR family transcriptional regulator [Microbacterium sp. cx-59]MCC4908726.1 MarR family transcriptional regulator [Microbacterium sp. cx-59]
MADALIPGMTTEQTRAWRALMGMTTWLPAALDIQLQRDAGISNAEYGALSALALAETRSMRLTELARMANSALSRISKMVSRFEEQGWVRREADPDDRRATRAVLTRDGYRKVAAATPDHVEFVQRLVFAALTPEQIRGLAEAAESITAAAGPDGACSSRMS